MAKRMILKYPLLITERQTVLIPKDSELLSIQLQTTTTHGTLLTAWFLTAAEENRSRKTDARNFVITGTGFEFDDDGLLHVATVQDGQYVWHVFEDMK